MNNINTYLTAHFNNTPPWKNPYGDDESNPIYENIHLETIEESINRKLLFERKDI